MITYANSGNDAVWELYGLSTDEKPVEGIPNGSQFVEMDTGSFFLFDSEGGKWWLWLEG